MLADLVVVFHFAVVIFVVTGAALLFWRRWVAWIHLPVIAWVIFAELYQRMCPLTLLENWLRDKGGSEVYRGDFVAHYIMPVLYPDGLTARTQVIFGTLIFAINSVMYIAAFARKPGKPNEESIAPVGSK
jgi:hypothetical protein